MANDILSSFLGGQQAGQEQRTRRTLADFLQPALGGDQNALSQVFAADPSAGLQVQGMAQKQQAADHDQKMGELEIVSRAWQSMPQMRQQLYPTVVELTEAVMPQFAGKIPREYNPAFEANIDKFLSGFAGQEDNTPASIRELQMLRDNPELADLDMRRRTAGFDRPTLIPSSDGYAVANLRTGTAMPLNYGNGDTGPAIGSPSSDYQDIFADIAARHGSQVTSGIRPVLPGVGAGANSQHPKGTAADFRTNGLSPQQVDAMMQELRSRGFEVIDERDNRNGRGPHIHSELPPGGRRVMPAQKDQAPSALQERIAAAQAMGASDDDIRRMVIGREGAAAGAEPIPVQALNQLLSVEDALNASQVVSDIIKKHADRMTRGELEVYPEDAIGARLRTAIGRTNANDVNVNEFRADMTRIVNESLRLNKGVQTEGDAQRAAQELMAANDQKTAARAMKRLAELNQRAVQLQRQKQALVRKNYGQDAEGNPLGQQPATTPDDDDALIGKYL